MTAVSYTRPDGTTATYHGSVGALMLIDGHHTPAPPNEYLAGGRDANGTKRPSGNGVDHIMERIKSATLLGTTTVAVLRAAAGEPLPVGEESETCDQCDGTGEDECPTCGHEATCEECDGSGYVMVRDDPDPVYMQFGDKHYNNQILAPLLHGLPDEPVVVSQRGDLLFFQGAGWRIVAISITHKGDEDESRPYEFATA